MFHIKGILLIYASALSYGHLVHGRATQFLDHEDWGEYVESPHEISDYDVVVPTVIHNERHRRSEVNNLPSQLTFTAFGEDYQLSLSPSQKFFSPDLEIEYVHGDGTIEKTKMPFDEDCFYDGHVVSHNSSGAVVSICDENIRGIISSSDVAVFITPLTALHAQEYARRYKRSSSKFHLVYKRSVDGVPGFCGVKETPEQELNENKAAQFNAASPENSFIAPKYLEINLILDVDFVDKYSPDHVVIATTVMNAVSRRYSDPSLGISLRLYIVRMIVLNTDTPTIDGTSFFIDPVLGQQGDTLDSVREWSLAVNPQGDDIPGHWDNVVILSGKALIYQDDTTDNTLLGIAFNGGTCIGELGVSISTDLGLASAFIIAHEIGHTLTLLHDEDIGCSEGFIMSGFLLPGPNASLWSSCSRTNLQEYLRWQLPDYQTECMDDIPLGVDVLQTLQLPGRTYSWDQQCDMLIPGSTSCGEIECSNIACSEPSGDCLPQGFPVAEGTPCGAGLINEICLAGVCSLESAIPVPVNGGWSVWSETQCSRTCGGGVIIRQRVCNNPAPVFGGDPCDGEGVEFRLCNLNSCQTTSDDFRDEQCAATQSEPTPQGTVTQWTQFFAPFIINEEQYCSNPCQSMQLMFALRPPRMNTDGTECWNYRQTDESILLRCVSGTCQRFGCDGLQRGNLQVFDVCRVCGGDGSTCTRQADNGTASTVSVFNQIVEIPVGSTSILIINNNVAGGNHIAISSPVSGDKFRGSGFSPDVTTRAFVGPYVIVHESTSTTESFRIPGPIPEPLVVELFLSNVQASPIQYEYYTSDFFWNIGVFGPCSATCNGVQMRTVTCTSGVGGAQSILADNICENNIGPKPETTRSCNEFVCPRWVVGDFGECTGVCGSGTQTRIVTCQQENTIVSNTMCDPLLEPQSQQTCNLGNCVWVPGPFGPCSVTCGLGTQSTIFVCMNNLFPVAENDCLDPVPANNQTCFAGSCDVPRWVIASAFSECSTNCGKGTQRRLVECRTGSQVIDDNNCDSRSMPNKSQVCISIRCLLDDDCEPVENPFVRRGPNSNTGYNAP